MLLCCRGAKYDPLNLALFCLEIAKILLTASCETPLGITICGICGLFGSIFLGFKISFPPPLKNFS